jgi:hypothetical protein
MNNDLREVIAFAPTGVPSRISPTIRPSDVGEARIACRLFICRPAQHATG